MKNTICLFTLLLMVSCNEDEPAPIDPSSLNEPKVATGAPANAMTTFTGVFTSFAHSLSGKASVYTFDDQKRTIQLEEFTMTAGPDVYVFVSKSNNYSQSNTIGVAMLTNGYSNSTLSIPLDASINLQTHPYVLVYCLKYNSLFGYAELK